MAVYFVNPEAIRSSFTLIFVTVTNLCNVRPLESETERVLLKPQRPPGANLPRNK